MAKQNIFTKIFSSLSGSEKKEERKIEADKRQSLADYINELGVARDAVIGGYNTEENPDSLNPEDYIKMQNNDGEVASIVNLISLPIQSTEYNFIPAKNDNGELDFIINNFTAPKEQGGMSTPLPLVIADMTRAVFEGYRFYEKVAQIIKEGPYEGLIGWQKLAPRDADTIQIRVDKYGGFMGGHQEATFGEETVDVNIPPEKSMLFTFRKEKHQLYGESILKSAYYHYDKKHKLYYIAHKTAEIEGMGVRLLKPLKQLDSTEREAAEEAVDNMGINSRLTLPPGYDMEWIFGGKGKDGMPLIQHHNLMMAKSAMQSFMSLGTEGKGGSYALGKTQAEWYSMFIESILRQMEATINTYAIPQLIKWNFGTNAYPTLRFNPVEDRAGELLKAVFTEISKKDLTVIPDGFVKEVIDKTAENLGLEYAVTSTEKTNEDAKKMTEKEKVNLEDRVESKFWRSLTQAEKSVDFEGIENKMKTQEKELADRMNVIFEKEIPIVSEEVKKLVDAGKEKQIKKIELPFQDELRELIKEKYTNIFQFGKLKAADELKKASPKTDNKIKKAIDKKVKEFMDTHKKNVLEHISENVKNIPKQEGVKLQEFESVTEVVDNSLSSMVAATFASLVISTGLNSGRDATFDEYANDISRYQYSAILDRRTCNVCMSLDGRVVKSTDSAYAEYEPPRHFSCRCLDDSHDVLTKKGIKNIKDIQIGDYVMTHKNRYRKVTGRSMREADELYEIETNKGTIRCTPEHPILTKRGWVNAKDLTTEDVVQFLK